MIELLYKFCKSYLRETIAVNLLKRKFLFVKLVRLNWNDLSG